MLFKKRKNVIGPDSLLILAAVIWGFGFVAQKFSGGGTTQSLWGGYEFGSNKFKQFPLWSGRAPGGIGSLGLFIYPTLRAEQPHIIAQWENAFTKILKEW